MANANIFSQFLQPARSVADFAEDHAKVDAYQQKARESNALRKLAAGWTPETSQDQQIAGLRSSGMPGLMDRANALEKSGLERQKAKAAAEKDQLETTLKKVGLASQLLGSVRDEASYQQALTAAQGYGIDTAGMPQAYDSAFVQRKFQEGQTVTQQLEQKWKAMEYSTPTANARLGAESAAAGRAVTRRGQDMTDSRAREFNAAKAEENRIKQEQGKPLNEGQGKALLFGSRMREADKIIEQLTSEGSATSVPGSRAPLIGGIINSLSSGNQQMLDQAKRDFMSAVLRRESGASISDGEYDNADKQYFPQIGDSEGVIAQKAKNRKLALDGILLEVPAQHRGTLQPTERTTAPASPELSGMEAELRRRGLLK